MQKKLRVWDNELLGQVYVTSQQMQVQIQQMLAQLTEQDLTDLPHSMVPTSTLYEILISNDLMYNMLIDNELIKSGNKKQDLTKTH